MRGAGGEIAVMQIVGLDPALDQGAQQLAENFRIVVDAAQQDRLAEQGNAGIDQARAGDTRLHAESF